MGLRVTAAAMLAVFLTLGVGLGWPAAEAQEMAPAPANQFQCGRDEHSYALCAPPVPLFATPHTVAASPPLIIYFIFLPIRFEPETSGPKTPWRYSLSHCFKLK